MATYRTIAASETDSESPITQELMDALRLNTEAQAEGAVGAPKQESASMGLLTAYILEGTTGVAGGEVILPSVDTGFSRKYMIYFSGYLILNINDEIGDSNVSLEGSNDNTTWTELLVLGATDGNAVTLKNGLFVFYLPWRYFRIWVGGDSDHDWRSGDISFGLPGPNPRDGYRMTFISTLDNQITP